MKPQVTPTIDQLGAEYRVSLRARGCTDKTITIYSEGTRFLERWLAEQGHSCEVGAITRAHIEGFIADQLERCADSTVNNRYRSLQAFFKWLTAEELIERNPMATTRPPIVAEKPVVVIPGDHLRRLLKGCEGRGFVERRDSAIVRLFLDTGIRLKEMTALTVGDVDLDLGVAVVLGKGRRPRSVPYGARTSQALARYLRERSMHREAHSDALWLGLRGPFGASGIGQMIARRCADVGLPRLRPHQFRHTFSHQWLAAGGKEGDLMRLAGWTSSQMLRRYGASAADARAHQAHRTFGFGDRL